MLTNVVWAMNFKSEVRSHLRGCLKAKVKISNNPQNFSKVFMNNPENQILHFFNICRNSVRSELCFSESSILDFFINRNLFQFWQKCGIRIDSSIHNSWMAHSLSGGAKCSAGSLGHHSCMALCRRWRGRLTIIWLETHCFNPKACLTHVLDRLNMMEPSNGSAAEATSHN